MSIKALLPAIYVIIASLLWATDATLRNSVFSGNEARTIAFVENLIAFIVVAPLIFQSGHARIMPMMRKEWLLFAILGIGGSALAGTIFTLGVERLGPGLAAVFTFLQPLAVLILAFLFLKERSSPAFYFTALWVIANSILISLPSYSLDLSEEDASKLWGGAGFAILATLIWGGTTVAGKSLLKSFSPLIVLVWRFGFASVFLFLTLLFVPEPVDLKLVLSDRGLLAVIFLGIVTNALAYFVYYQGLKVLPVRVVAFIEVLYPIFGVFIPIWTSGADTSVFHVFGSITLVISILILLSIEYPRKITGATDPLPRSRFDP